MPPPTDTPAGSGASCPQEELVDNLREFMFALQHRVRETPEKQEVFRYGGNQHTLYVMPQRACALPMGSVTVTAED